MKEKINVKNIFLVGLTIIATVLLIKALMDIIPNRTFFDFFRTGEEIDDAMIIGILSYENYRKCYQCFEGTRLLKIALVVYFVDIVLFLFLNRQNNESVRNNNNNLEDITKLKELYDKGIISKEEFEAKKKQILEL